MHRIMWHFADLNEAQKHERRRLLDLYGTIAQYSALVPLLFLQIYLLCCYIRKRWIGRSNDAELETPSSPYRKKQRQSTLHSRTEKLKVTWRQTAWWAGEKIEFLGFTLMKGEIVAAAIWTAWLLLLSLLQTEDGKKFSYIFLNVPYCYADA